MGYEFPDTERAVAEIIGGTLWLADDFTDTLPTHHVYSVGGTETGPLRMDRITVDTYAPGRTAAKAAAESANSELTSGPHGTSAGLIDHVEVEVAPHGIPYPSATVNQYAAVYRVHTRPSKAAEMR